MDNIRNGRFKTGMTDEAAIYTSSLEADKLLFEADIKTNFAHTSMLKHEGIVDGEIADKILDAILVQDADARVAIEVMATNRLIVIGGELTTSTYVDVVQLA